MSKKRMTRTAALSALIAISLSGTVMAAELTIDYANGQYTATGTGIATDIVQGTQGDLFTALENAGWATHNSSRNIINGNIDSYSGNTITVTNADLSGSDASHKVNINGANITAIAAVGEDTNNNTIILDNSIVTNQVAAANNKNTGDAKNNTVIIRNGSIIGSDTEGTIYGAIIATGTAEGNKVEIINSQTITPDFINGKYYGVAGASTYASGEDLTAYVKNNEVIVNNSEIAGMLWGGIANSNAAEGNKVTVVNGSVCDGEIFGGHTDSGKAVNNVVTITESTVDASVYGGASVIGGDVIGNKVIINSGVIGNAPEDTVIYGGYSTVSSSATDPTPATADVTENEVIIKDGTINSIVYGGKSNTTLANENIVTITGGTLSDATKNIYGGYGVTEASGNTVTITGGTFADGKRIYGGYAPSGEAHDNAVTIKDVTVAKVYGGWSDGDATGNTINVENANITTNDSNVSATCTAGDSQNGDAIGNTISITNSTVTYVTGGSARGTTSNGTNNTVSITNSTVKKAVWGTSVDGTGDAVGNTVTLDNVKFENGAYVTGGHSELGNATDNVLTISGDNTEMGGYVFGGRAQDAHGAANNNTVTITGGTFNGTAIYGGQAAESAAENNTGVIMGDANNNIVSISNAEINSAVYGGASIVAGKANDNTVTITDSTINKAVYGGSGKDEANNNTVNINGTADLANASLYGSNHADGTGNVLNVNDGWTGDVKSVQNFNEINIAEAQWGTAAVTVTDTLALNDTKVTASTVHVAGDDTTFAEGASSTLISADTITGSISADSSATVYKGIASVYEGEVVQDGNNINIQIPASSVGSSSASINSQVFALGESRAAATAFVNQGSELIELGLDTLARDKSEDETKVFAAVYGNSSRFSTGSHVKVNGWSGIVGAAQTSDDGFTKGFFFENGIGDYRTYNHLGKYTLRGEGEAKYNGGGILLRKDNENGTYTEGSLRAGNLSNELDDAVRGSRGLAGYDIDTFYYGAHVGIGKVIPKGKDSLDIYGKFLYTHHDSESFVIDGDDIRFDSMDSQRLRLGLRYNKAQTDRVDMYYGAAYEYEFSGDADYSVIGHDLTAPSLGGSTVIGEIGVHYIADARWNIDFNLRGYGGQREGVSGSMQVNYIF